MKVTLKSLGDALSVALGMAEVASGPVGTKSHQATLHILYRDGTERCVTEAEHLAELDQAALPHDPNAARSIKTAVGGVHEWLALEVFGKLIDHGDE